MSASESTIPQSQPVSSKPQPPAATTSPVAAVASSSSSKIERTPLQEAALIVRNRLKGKTFLIYGPPKIGKTTTALSFPKPYVISFERGHSFVDPGLVYECPYGKEGWEAFQTQLNNKVGLQPFDTVIVDTLDAAYQACFEYTCAEGGFEHPDLIPGAKGNGWSAIKREFANNMHRLIDACKGKHLIFIAHSKLEMVEHHGYKYQRFEPALGKQAYETVVNAADYIWHLAYDIGLDEKTADAADHRKALKAVTERRVLMLHGGSIVLAGGRDKFLPDYIRDFNGERGYKEIVVALAKHLLQMATSKAATATTEGEP